MFPTDVSLKLCYKGKEWSSTNNDGILLTFCDLALLNTFQKRRVSSPAPVTIASPSGDTAYKNKEVQYI